MKQKFYFILTFILCACYGIVSAQSITIKGKVQFPSDKNDIRIIKDKTIIDSCNIRPDGTYELKMAVKEPGVYVLDCQKVQNVKFWAENENLEINFRGRDTAKVKSRTAPYVHINGGDCNEVMNLVNWDAYCSNSLISNVDAAIFQTDGLTPELKKQTYGNVRKVLVNDAKNRTGYIATLYTDRNSVLTLIPKYRTPENAEWVDAVFATLEKKNPKYPPLLIAKADIAEATAMKESMENGQIAPEFSFSSPEGKKIGPQNFKGKVLILDFWASWCGPCRKEMQNLKEVYKKYNPDGLEILSVSIDRDEKAWRKALAEEGMPWQQVLAPEAGKSIMKQYQFGMIPFLVVLDRDGRIAGKVRGEAMIKLIESLLTK